MKKILYIVLCILAFGTVSHASSEPIVIIKIMVQAVGSDHVVKLGDEGILKTGERFYLNIRSSKHVHNYLLYVDSVGRVLILQPSQKFSDTGDKNVSIGPFAVGKLLSKEQFIVLSSVSPMNVLDLQTAINSGAFSSNHEMVFGIVFGEENVGVIHAGASQIQRWVNEEEITVTFIRMKGPS